MLNSGTERCLFLGLLATGMLVLAGSSGAENRLSLEPPGETLETGTPFTVVLSMDFTDTTTGGGFTLQYSDAILTLDEVSFEGDLGDDPDFQCPESPKITCPGDDNFISFGTVSGLSGQRTVATLTFTPIAAGSTGISLEAVHGFGSVGGTELTVVFDGISVGGGPSVPSLSRSGLALLAFALLLTACWARKRIRTDPLGVSGALMLVAILLSVPSTVRASDSDADGVLDSSDNCTNVANPDQRDSNADGYGNLCDADLDDDNDIDSADLDLLKLAFFGSDPDADLDGNGVVNFLDLGIMAERYGEAPGPGSSTFTTSPNLSIPDGVGVDAPSTNTIVDDITILDLQVAVVISHSWIGDLTVTLTHVETGTSAVLIDRPGAPDTSFGCSGDDIDATLSDDATLPVEDECASSDPSIQGEFAPNNPLAIFDGESTAGNWKLTVSDANSGDVGTLNEWGLLVNPPPPPLAITMTAYRPQSETYGNPLQRRPVLEADEQTPGVGVRQNGDDDDGDGVADRDDPSVTNENDLIEVELGVNQLAPTGVQYRLRRTESSIKVWDTASKDTALLDEDDELVIEFAAKSRSVWVESPNGGDATLEFEALSTADDSVVASDAIDFFAFSSLLIGLHGEFQFPTDPVYGPNEGISYLAVAFHEEAYDSHMYMENEVASDGSGSVYDEIVSAVQNRGVTQIAMYGFSHGGGSIYDLSERLDANKTSIGTFEITFTGYIDAIENDSDTDLDAEVRLPVGTQYHVNYYQSSFFWWIWGDSVPGSDVDELVTGVSHISITNDLGVQNGIHDALVLRVSR